MYGTYKSIRVVSDQVLHIFVYPRPWLSVDLARIIENSE